MYGKNKYCAIYTLYFIVRLDLCIDSVSNRDYLEGTEVDSSDVAKRSLCEQMRRKCLIFSMRSCVRAVEVCVR